MASGKEPDDLVEEPIIPGWAHVTGRLALGEGVSAVDAVTLGDRLAICERISRYCWAYDERRLDLLTDCFTADAVWEGTVLGRVNVGPFAGRPQIGRWLSEFWPHQKDQRRHMIHNTIVEQQDGDSALTLSYLLLMASTGSEASIESMGFYQTAYRREGAVWRISRLTAGFDKPFWPGQLRAMSARGRVRHGVSEAI